MAQGLWFAALHSRSYIQTDAACNCISDVQLRNKTAINGHSDCCQLQVFRPVAEVCLSIFPRGGAQALSSHRPHLRRWQGFPADLVLASARHSHVASSPH